jgi:hypothetical protein
MMHDGGFTCQFVKIFWRQAPQRLEKIIYPAVWHLVVGKNLKSGVRKFLTGFYPMTGKYPKYCGLSGSLKDWVWLLFWVAQNRGGAADIMKSLREIRVVDRLRPGGYIRDS